MRKAARKGGQVICLPELYRSAYFCQKEDTRHFDLAEPLHRTSFEAFSALAKELGVVISVPFFERRAAGLYHNSAYLIDADGSQAGLYRKMHIPDDPSFYEKFYFTPGDLGFMAHSTAFGKIGTLICWDQWYPEAARITALQGAQVLFYPTAIGWHPHEKAEHGARQHDAWMTVQRGHAVANGIYVAAVNRVGLEQPEKGQPGLEFWGVVVCRRTAGRDHRPGIDGPGGDPGGRGRPRPHGRRAPQLAFSAGPPDRCLRRYPETVS